MKLKLELKLRNVYGGDGFTRIEKIPEQKFKRSKKKVVTRQDIGVPIESDLEEVRTELTDKPVNTFKRDEKRNYYLRLGGIHGKLWGVLKSSAEIIKDSSGEFGSFAEISRIMRSVNILPVWVKLEKIKGLTVEQLPQVLAGGRGAMIVQLFDVIEECNAEVELVFPDVLEKKIRIMLKQAETIGCLNKRRGSIEVVGS